MISRLASVCALAFSGVAIAVCMSAPVAAEEPVRRDCLPHIRPTSELRFDDDMHRHWWRRFWTGSCTGLPMFQCFPGRPSWNDAITKLLAKVANEERPALLAQACALGETIGFEWAKDNSIRCIDTARVSEWGTQLDASAHPLETVHQLEVQAKSKLNCR